MKKFLLPFVLLINNLNAQWITQPCPSVNNLFSVFAISPSAVAAAGFTGVLRSINAGGSWSQNVTLGGVNMYEIHTKTTTKWYSLCQNASWFVKTLNPSGVTLQSGKPDSILSLHFMNQACAIAVGTAGKIEATCDTGATWQLRTSTTANALNAVWFANKDTGCAVGVGGTIARTLDAGNTWTTVPSGTPLTLNGIHFPTSLIGFAVGNGGKVIKTNNAGATWTNVPTGVLNTINGVFFIDKDTGYVVGTGGMILKTINSGASWLTMNSGTAQNLNSVHFVTPIDGWAVGNVGTILKYGGTCATPPAPTNSTNVVNQTICAGNTTTLTAFATGTVNWFANPSGGAILGTGFNFITATLPAGTYTFFAETFTCTTSATRTPITVTVNPLPILSGLSTSSLLCTGQTATITAGGASTYTWNPGGAVISIVVSPTTTTNYTLSGTDANGCMNSSIITQSVSTCLGLTPFLVLNSVFSIYPNPVGSVLTVRSEIKNSSVKIYNTLGKLVYKSDLFESEIKLNVNDLPAGIYFIECGSGNNISVKKFVKE